MTFQYISTHTTTTHPSSPPPSFGLSPTAPESFFFSFCSLSLLSIVRCVFVADACHVSGSQLLKKKKKLFTFKTYDHVSPKTSFLQPIFTYSRRLKRSCSTSARWMPFLSGKQATSFHPSHVRCACWICLQLDQTAPARQRSILGSINANAHHNLKKNNFIQQ